MGVLITIKMMHLHLNTNLLFNTSFQKHNVLSIINRDCRSPSRRNFTPFLNNFQASIGGIGVELNDDIDEAVLIERLVDSIR